MESRPKIARKREWNAQCPRKDKGAGAEKYDGSYSARMAEYYLYGKSKYADV